MPSSSARSGEQCGCGNHEVCSKKEAEHNGINLHHRHGKSRVSPVRLGLFQQFPWINVKRFGKDQQFRIRNPAES